MPKVSEFFGISVYMYYRDHAPAHFHAMYAGSEVLIALDSLAVLRGHLPPRAMGLVIEWADIRRKELHKVWDQAQVGQRLDKIDPLR